jgi:succinyl-CoA synthetase beta subunit
MATDKSIQVILINLVGSIPQSAQFAQVIGKFLQQDKNELKSQVVRSNGTNGNKSRRENGFVRVVVRLVGSEFTAAKKYLASLKTNGDGLIVVENLDEAVEEAVRLSKTIAYKR